MKTIGLLMLFVIVLLMFCVALYNSGEDKRGKMTVKQARRLLECSKVKVTPEQSAKIQKLAFELGFKWWPDTTKVINTDKQFLYFKDGLIMFGFTYKGFRSDKDYTERSAEDILKIKITD